MTVRSDAEALFENFIVAEAYKANVYGQMGYKSPTTGGQKQAPRLTWF